MFTSMFHNSLPCLHVHSKQFNAVKVREVYKPAGSPAASKTNIIKIKKIIRQNVTRKAKEPNPPIVNLKFRVFC